MGWLLFSGEAFLVVVVLVLRLVRVGAGAALVDFMEVIFKE